MTRDRGKWASPPDRDRASPRFNICLDERSQRQLEHVLRTRPSRSAAVRDALDMLARSEGWRDEGEDASDKIDAAAHEALDCSDSRAITRDMNNANNTPANIDSTVHAWLVSQHGNLFPMAVIADRVGADLASVKKAIASLKKSGLVRADGKFWGAVV